MSRLLGRRGVTTAVVVVVAIAVGGIAYASIPDWIDFAADFLDVGSVSAYLSVPPLA